MPSAPPVALTIAGSDNCAGAGLQADLKTFTANGVFGLTAVTCVVAEVPGKVSAIRALDAEMVREQIELSCAAYPVGAIKTGMLYSREIIEMVAATLGRVFPNPDARPPLVVDPVMVASSGDPLLRADAVEAYRVRLFPVAALVTPNLDETCTLLGRSIHSLAEMRAAGEELALESGVPFLLKGGHLGGETATDLLIADGSVTEFSAPFVKGVSPHGTGCTYSAAITAGLARGLPLVEAVGDAKRFITRAIQTRFCWRTAGGDTVALNQNPDP